MAEASKTSGENGEKITEELLRLIGWEPLISGIDVPCQNTAHESRSKSGERKEHGNDFIFIYNNPLHDNRTDVIYVSSKHVNKDYPKGEQGVRTRLKKHLSELDAIVSCSKISTKIAQMLNSFTGRKQKKSIWVCLYGFMEIEKIWIGM